jgi:hypothetical protein
MREQRISKDGRVEANDTRTRTASTNSAVCASGAAFRQAARSAQRRLFSAVTTNLAQQRGPVCQPLLPDLREQHAAKRWSVAGSWQRPETAGRLDLHPNALFEKYE